MDKESRAARMINALRKDKITLERLKIPSYESTKGLTKEERKLAIAGFNRMSNTTIPVTTVSQPQLQSVLPPTTPLPPLSASRCTDLEIQRGNNNQGDAEHSPQMLVSIASAGIEAQLINVDHNSHQTSSSNESLIELQDKLVLELENNIFSESSLVVQEHKTVTDIPSQSGSFNYIDVFDKQDSLSLEQRNSISPDTSFSFTVQSIEMTLSRATEEKSLDSDHREQLNINQEDNVVHESNLMEPINIVPSTSKEGFVDYEHNSSVNMDVSQENYGSPDNQQITTEKERNLTVVPFEDDSQDSNKEKNEHPEDDKYMKKKRRWDRRNFCIFCESTFSNFRRHLLRAHKKEEPVARYLALLETCPEESKKQRQEIFAELRRKGNFIHNQGLLKDPVKRVTHADELLPERRPPLNAKKTPEDFVTCMFCYKLCSKKSFYKHVPSCKEKNCNTTGEGVDEEDISEDNLETILRPRKCPNFGKRYGINARPIPVEVSKTMENKIIPSLTKDDIGRAAASDPLIVSIANDFLSNHLNAKDKYNVTRKMRDSAMLLIKVKESDSSIVQLKDCFNPLKANIVLNAIQDLCGCNTESGSVKTIGMPARLAWVINEGGTRLIDDIICNAQMTENERQTEKKKVDDFLCVFKRRWKYAVSTNAEKSRKVKRIDKPFAIPPDEDIIEFSRFLNEEENMTYGKLKSNVTVHSYERLCKLTIAHIITLNRRRPAEAAQGTLEMYLNRGKDDYVSPIIKETLTQDELRANNELNLYVVPGKLVRHVPVLLTNNMQRNIDLLISCRKQLSIPPSNSYLFARPQLDTPFVGSTIMAELRQECPNLKKPQFLTATGLRHHIASVSQVEGDTFTESLCTFMGHTKDVHKKNYRLPSHLVHKGIVGQKMMRYEAGPSSAEGKQKHNISQTAESSATNVSESRNTGTKKIKLTKIPSQNVEQIPFPTENEEEEYILNNDSDDTDSSEEIKDKQVKTRQRRRWTDEEKKIIVIEFKEYISKKVNPGLKLCSQVIKKHPVLKGRTCQQVNIYIDNLNRGKFKFPPKFKHLLE